MTVVSILATSTVGYGLAAKNCIDAILAQTDFHIHVAGDHLCKLLIPPHARVHFSPAKPEQQQDRGAPFLAKFSALRSCLSTYADEIILQIDADVVLACNLTTEDLVEALRGRQIAMVEQKRTIGTGTTRNTFLQHYNRISKHMIAPGSPTPEPEDFRYYNSGVVVMRRAEAARIIDWVEQCRSTPVPAVCPDGHMIADQDYFQVWTNSIHPQSCTELSWKFNHCELWDTNFPDTSAVFMHFSNFCNGPTLETVGRMRQVYKAASSAPQRTPEILADRSRQDVTVVIVTHNSADVVEMCLEAVQTLGCRCIVVDNASSDETVALVSQTSAKLVRNNDNQGFAAAANAGARIAETSTVCFLNSDCILTSEVLASAIALISADPERLLVANCYHWNGESVAGCQPGYTRRKLLADILDSAGADRLSRMVRDHHGHHASDWSWPLAACLFADKQVFFALGGFDQSYYCYMEDVQLGRTANLNGVGTQALNGKAVHFGAHGAKIPPARRARMIDSARFKYARKNYGAVLEMTLRIVRAVAPAVAWGRR